MQNDNSDAEEEVHDEESHNLGEDSRFLDRGSDLPINVGLPEILVDETTYIDGGSTDPKAQLFGEQLGIDNGIAVLATLYDEWSARRSRSTFEGGSTEFKADVLGNQPG